MSYFRPIDRETAFLFPPSVDEWLPQRHLARYVVEVVEGLAANDARIKRRSLVLSSARFDTGSFGQA